MATVPQLLEQALTGAVSAGPERCFYCGASCAAAHRVSQYVQDSFTGRGDVAAPGSPWICGGCVLCLRECCAVDLVDGTRARLVTKGAMRAFSWVICQRQALAASKAHLAQLRSYCLAPPEPPFALVLSDSGKKHLLYRGIVCHSREFVTLTLEGERIDYRPAELAELLLLCQRLIAAAGKPALGEPPAARFAISVSLYYPEGLDLVRKWEEVYGQPQTSLAVWLSPGRDECRAFAAAGLPGFSPKTRRPD